MEGFMSKYGDIRMDRYAQRVAEEADRQAMDAETIKPWWEQTVCFEPRSFDLPRKLMEARSPGEAALEQQDCANAWAAFQKQGQASKKSSSSADLGPAASQASTD